MTTAPIRVRTLFLVAAALCCISACARAPSMVQPSLAQVAPPTTLEKAQLSNQWEHAKLERDQAIELEEKKERNPWLAFLEDNGIGIAAAIGATITVISFLNAWRRSVDSAWELQFFEALKRLGDKDSSLVRASAAANVSALLSRGVPGAIFRRPLVGRTKRYFQVAFSEYVTLITLETEIQCIRAIKRSAAGLVQINANIAAIALQEFDRNSTRRALQLEMSETIGFYLASRRLSWPSGNEDKSLALADTIAPLLRSSEALDKAILVKAIDVERARGAFDREADRSLDTSAEGMRAENVAVGVTLAGLRVTFERLACFNRVIMNAKQLA